MNFIDVPTTVFFDRTEVVEFLIFHYTAVPTLESSLEILTTGGKVSCHYLIDVDGTIYRLLDENKAARHAGISFWMGKTALNNSSIGIELQNTGAEPFPGEQMASLLGLSRDILSRHQIPHTQILGHSDIAPGRKIDPGPHFPWEFFANQGVGIYPPQLGMDVCNTSPISAEDSVSKEEAINKLKKIGYDISIPDQNRLISAFQSHFFAGNVNGDLDEKTVRRICEVEQAFCYCI